MKWTNIPENYDDYVGFVYLITEKDTGMKYIGLTRFWSVDKKKPGKYKMKEGKYLKDNNNKRILETRTTKKHIRKETDWRNYCGSNKILSEKIKQNPNNYEKRIIQCWNTITQLKAYEAYLQLQAYFNGEWNDYYNEHIGFKLRIRKEK